MSEATFEGSTLDAAIEQAVKELGVAASDLQHEVVESKQDFWGGGDTVVIKAWVPAAEPQADTPASAEEAQESEPVAAAEPVVEPETPAASEETPAVTEVDPAPADDGAGGAFWDTDAAAEAGAEAEAEAVAEAVAAPAEAVEEPAQPAASTPAPPASAEAAAEGVDPEAIKALLVQIFHDMEFDCTVEIKAQDDGFLATVDGADKEALLEGNGRCLSALELILNNAFRHKLPRGSKVHVDAGDFRSRRDQELADLALQVAHSAKDSGRTQETQPLNPYERRLVHLALAENSGVTTRSRGTGFLKNVQVIPENADSGGQGRR